MTNELQQFKFSDTEIRVVRGEDGEPRFVAKDIVEGIGATWTGHALDLIPTEWKGMVSVTTPRRNTAVPRPYRTRRLFLPCPK